MGIFKKAKQIIGFVLKTAVILIIACVIMLLLLPERKSVEYHSMPYAMVKEEQEVFRNAAVSYDFYLAVKQGEKQYSAIYNFDVWAGVDFGQELPEKLNDSSYLLPYPHILSVDQNDSEKPFVLKEKGDLEYNTDIKPAKEAMEKMAIDCARRSDLLERSADNMLEYIQSMGTPYSYNRAEKTGIKPFTLDFPNLPVSISYYPDLLSNREIYDIDTILYNRYEVIFYSENEPVFTISYFGPENFSHEEFDMIMEDWANNYDWKDIHLVDPVNPNEKTIHLNEYEAYVYMDGIVYHAKRYIQNDENFYQKYMPDMLYLLSCMHADPNRTFSTDYLSWLKEYDACIDNINNARWSSAISNLNNMHRYQHDSTNYNENYMWSLVSVANDDDPRFVPDNDEYNLLLSGYYNMKHGYEIDSEDRGRLLNIVRNYGLEGLDEELERYYCIYCHCSENESDGYLLDIIQKGQVIDKELVNTMNAKQFQRFFTNLIHQTIREKDGENYSIDQIKLWFPEEVDKRNDMRPIKLIKRTLGEADNFGTKEDIVDNLNKICREKFGKDMFQMDASLVYLYEQESGFLGFGTRRDAVIFTKNELIFVADYEGNSKKDAKQAKIRYEDIKLEINPTSIRFKEKGRECESRTVIGMVQKIKAAYENNSWEKYRDELQTKMKNSIVNESARYIFTEGGQLIDPDIVERFK